MRKYGEQFRAIIRFYLVEQQPEQGKSQEQFAEHIKQDHQEQNGFQPVVADKFCRFEVKEDPDQETTEKKDEAASENKGDGLNAGIGLRKPVIIYHEPDHAGGNDHPCGTQYGQRYILGRIYG